MCVHRNECIRVYMSACSCTDAKKKAFEVPQEDRATRWLGRLLSSFVRSSWAFALLSLAQMMVLDDVFVYFSSSYPKL